MSQSVRRPHTYATGTGDWSTSLGCEGLGHMPKSFDEERQEGRFWAIVRAEIGKESVA